ncbi:MAG: DUF1501 domain-containing protein [Acidimicrobiia bacterium]
MTNNAHLEAADALEMLSVEENDRFRLGRRAFLQAAAVGGAVAAMPWWLEQGAAWAAPPIGPNEGVLVMVMMAGGNDGLNTVVPANQGAYYDLRKGLAIAADKVLPLKDGFGLHPNLGTVKSLWDAGKVGIVQGVGYANPTLSHFDSMAIWMAGHSAGPSIGSGWLGRYLDSLPADPFYGVNIGRSVPLHVRGAAKMSTGLPEYSSGAFGADRRQAVDVHMYDAMKTYANGGQKGALATSFAAIGRDAINMAATIQPAYASLPSNRFARQMTLAARLINANLGIRVLTVYIDGFDTHSDQAGDHNDLMTAFDGGINAFYGNLQPTYRGRTTIATFSEFGRRPKINGSAGTDHGTTSCLFVIGDMVKGGLYGQHQSLTDFDRDGNFKSSVDFRMVYASLLNGWLGSDANAILGGNYGDLNMFNGAPAESVPGEDHGIPIFGGKNGSNGGYWIATSQGPVTAFGNVGHFGNPPFPTAVVGMASRPQLDGYWLVTAAGAVYAFGAAQYYGAMNDTPLNSPIVDIVATSSGKGYWMLGRDGGVFSFGDAAFYGSTGSIVLNQPVVGMASHPKGKGYWFVAADGGVFTYGPDAKFYGSTGSLRLNQPVVGMAPTPSGKGYWLVAADGGVFAFGDAPFYGSTGSMTLAKPIIGITCTPTGKGYWFVASDGGLFAFGDAPFHGSLAGKNALVVAMGG